MRVTSSRLKLRFNKSPRSSVSLANSSSAQASESGAPTRHIRPLGPICRTLFTKCQYSRKQATVGGERFITPELKEMEAKILGADDRAHNLEYQLFQKLRDETLREIEPIQQTADAIAVVDVLCALAETARLFRYCRP